MSQPTFYQGSADMLCGIYSAARLIACFKVKNNSPKDQQGFYEDAADEALRRLMGSVEDCGFLTARKLFESDPEKGGGFNDRQLQRIFNRLKPAERENLKAVAFSSQRLKRMRGSFARKILDAGACAIVNKSGENHWVTVEGRHRDGGHWSFDPSLDEPKSRIVKIGWKRGGLFIAEPEVIRFINAQTH